MPIEYSLPDMEPEGEPLSQRVLLIADNQEHFLYGEPIWLRRGLFDKAVGSAIRSPQLDLYGKDLLAWILEHAEDNKTIPIHLGDALNVSCSVEMDHFAQVMSRSKKAWFLMPGNHDGFFYGSGRQHREWDRACRNGGGRITTAGFVRRYLQLLARQPDAGARAFAAEADVTKGYAAWRYKGSGPAVLRRVQWRVHADNGPFWRSYVLQELDLTVNRSPRPRPVRVILMDTSQFQNEPGVIAQALPGVYDAGSIGSMLDDQFKTLESWLEENRRDDAETILMGHHPQGALIEPVRQRLHALRAAYGVQLYVSAHTHSSSYRVLKDGSSAQLELNVGSTLDWPAQYRTFQVTEREQDGARRVSIRSPRTELWRIWQSRTAPDKPEYPNCGARETAWYAQQRSNLYITYMDDNSALSSKPMQRKIMTSLLDSYARLLTVAPTAAATTWPGGATDDPTLLARIAELRKPAATLEQQERLLRELEAFEASRTAQNEAVHKEYRLCQALWSSSADRKRSRLPEADQWFLTFPESQAAKNQGAK